MTQIFITMQGYVKGEVVSVHDIKFHITLRCVISSVFQAHFTSDERAPNIH